jgi:hypothetical protein
MPASIRSGSPLSGPAYNSGYFSTADFAKNIGYLDSAPHQPTPESPLSPAANINLNSLTPTLSADPLFLTAPQPKANTIKQVLVEWRLFSESSVLDSTVREGDRQDVLTYLEGLREKYGGKTKLLKALRQEGIELPEGHEHGLAVIDLDEAIHGLQSTANAAKGAAHSQDTAAIDASGVQSSEDMDLGQMSEPVMPSDGGFILDAFLGPLMFWLGGKAGGAGQEEFHSGREVVKTLDAGLARFRADVVKKTRLLKSDHLTNSAREFLTNDLGRLKENIKRAEEVKQFAKMGGEVGLYSAISGRLIQANSIMMPMGKAAFAVNAGNANPAELVGDAAIGAATMGGLSGLFSIIAGIASAFLGGRLSYKTRLQAKLGEERLQILRDYGMEDFNRAEAEKYFSSLPDTLDDMVKYTDELDVDKLEYHIKVLKQMSKDTAIFAGGSTVYSAGAIMKLSLAGLAIAGIGSTPVGWAALGATLAGALLMLVKSYPFLFGHGMQQRLERYLIMDTPELQRKVLLSIDQNLGSDARRAIQAMITAGARKRETVRQKFMERVADHINASGDSQQTIKKYDWIYHRGDVLNDTDIPYKAASTPRKIVQRARQSVQKINPAIQSRAAMGVDFFKLPRWRSPEAVDAGKQRYALKANYITLTDMANYLTTEDAKTKDSQIDFMTGSLEAMWPSAVGLMEGAGAVQKKAAGVDDANIASLDARIADSKQNVDTLKEILLKEVSKPYEDNIIRVLEMRQLIVELKDAKTSGFDVNSNEFHELQEKFILASQAIIEALEKRVHDLQELIEQKTNEREKATGNQRLLISAQIEKLTERLKMAKDQLPIGHALLNDSDASSVSEDVVKSGEHDDEHAGMSTPEKLSDYIRDDMIQQLKHIRGIGPEIRVDAAILRRNKADPDSAGIGEAVNLEPSGKPFKMGKKGVVIALAALALGVPLAVVSSLYIKDKKEEKTEKAKNEGEKAKLQDSANQAEKDVKATQAENDQLKEKLENQKNAARYLEGLGGQVPLQDNKPSINRLRDMLERMDEKNIFDMQDDLTHPEQDEASVWG